MITVLAGLLGEYKNGSSYIPNYLLPYQTWDARGKLQGKKERDAAT